MLKIRNLALALGFALIGVILVMALRSVTNTRSSSQLQPNNEQATGAGVQLQPFDTPFPDATRTTVGNGLAEPTPDPLDTALPVVGDPIDLKIERPKEGTTLNITTYLSKEPPDKILAAYKDKVTSLNWTVDIESQEGLVFAYPRREMDAIRRLTIHVEKQENGLQEVTATLEIFGLP